MLRTLLLFLTAICLAECAFAQTPIRCNTLFWEVSGKGMKKPSYLYGTMHVSDKVAFKLQDSFFVALRSVDYVSLESDPELWLNSLYPTGGNPIQVEKRNLSGGSNFYKYAFFMSLLDNGELKGLIRYTPRILNGLFHRKESGMENFEENSFLDAFIFQAGRKYGKKFVPLEDLYESRELVTRADIAKELSVEESRLSSAQKKKILNGQSYGDFIEDAYRRGNLDLMDSVARLFNPEPLFHRYMLEIRNRNMVRSMDSLMKLGRVFAGVGAAHLPGTEGMVQMLRRMGYTLRPIYTNMEVESPFKAEVEKMKYPVKLQPFTDTDSLFSVRVPGPMTDISTVKSIKHFLYPDLSNGCFYMVLVSQNFGSLLGTSPERYRAKIDSMLFENIPGKITKKENRNLENGWKAIYIENTTSSGDQQVYRFYFTQHQFVLLRVQGFKDYVQGPEVSEFLNSFVLHDRRGPLRLRRFPEWGFEVSLPRQTFLRPTSRFPNTKPYCHILATGLDEEGKQFVLMRSPFHDFSSLEEDTFELNLMVEKFCKENQFTLKGRKWPAKTADPSLDFTAEFDKNPIQGRLVLAHPFYYLALTQSSKKAGSFFASLKTFRPEYPDSFAVYVDSTFRFRAEMPRFLTTRLSETKPYFSKPRKPKKKNEDPQPNEYQFDRTHVFTAVESQESVLVSFIRNSPYLALEAEDTLRKYRIRRLTDMGQLRLESQKHWQEKGMYISEYRLADTNTRGIVRVREILKGEYRYILKTHSDPEGPGGRFPTRFFETFSPIDIPEQPGLFQSKAQALFRDLYHSDEVIRATAKEAVEEDDYAFIKGDYPFVISQLRRKEFHQLPDKLKRGLLLDLQMSKSDTVAEFLRDFFLQMADSTELQFASLLSLARMKTPKSTAFFRELLLNQTPVLDKKTEAEQLLMPFFDSLGLARTLFPGILELTRYPEYKPSIHYLLAWLVFKNRLSPAEYQSYLPYLTREWRDEIRRQYNYDKEKKNNYGNRYSIQSEMPRPDSPSDPMEKRIFADPPGDGYHSGLGNVYLYALTVAGIPAWDPAQRKTILEKAFRIRDGLTCATLFSYFLKEGISIPDSVLARVNQEPRSRVFWLKRMQKFNMPERFPREYKDPERLAHDLIFTTESMDPKEDTLQFVRRIPGKNKYKQGWLYLFRKSDDKHKAYDLYISGIHPRDGKELLTANTFKINSREYDDEESLKKAIDEMVLEVRAQYRKRF